jgi:hypothetical protein
MIEEQMSDERVADGGAQSAEREADYRIADPVTDWVAERAYQVADGGQEAEDQIADDQVVDEENERAELVADQEAGWVADQVAEHIVDGITEIEQQIDRGTLVLLAAAAAAGSSSRHQAGKHTKVSVVSLVQVVDNSTGFQPTKEPKREEESQYSSIVKMTFDKRAEHHKKRQAAYQANKASTDGPIRSTTSSSEKEKEKRASLHKNNKLLTEYQRMSWVSVVTTPTTPALPGSVIRSISFHILVLILVRWSSSPGQEVVQHEIGILQQYVDVLPVQMHMPVMSRLTGARVLSVYLLRWCVRVPICHTSC